MVLRRAVLAVAGFAALSLACPGSLDPNEFGEAGAAMCPDVPALFAMRCGTAGCHAGMFPGGSLDLAQPNVAMRVIGVKSQSMCTGLIGDMGNPDDSVMIKKLKSTDCGTRMPIGQMPLTSQEVDCIKAWIGRGGN